MRRPGTLTASLAALAAAAAAVPATASAKVGPPKVTCAPGERARYPGRQVGHTPRTIVLGCVGLPDGDRLQIEGRPERSGGGTSSTCLSLTFEPQPTGSFTCPRRPPQGEAPELFLFLHPRIGEPVLAVGKVGASSAGIVATATTSSGAPRQADAEVIRVSRRLGRRVGAPGGFALFVAPFGAPILPCAGITLQSTHSDFPVAELPGPKRRSFMSLPDGGWIAGLTYSWGIGGGGTPRICDRSRASGEAPMPQLAPGLTAIQDAAASGAALARA